PLDLSARLNAVPAETATTFESPGGTLVCPSEPRPQLETVPSLLRTRLCEATETATALVKPAGMVLSPKVLRPQATKVPLVLRAIMRNTPQASCVNPLRLGGTLLSE